MNTTAMRLRTLLIVAMVLTPTGAFATEPLPPRALARIGDRRFYHGPGITCAVLSPDGRRAASTARYPDSVHVGDKERAAYNAAIVLWDAASGERLRELHTPQGGIYRLAFSPNGKRLAAAYDISEEKSSVVLFDVDSGKLLRRLDHFQNQIGYLQFSSDSKQLRVSEWGGPVSGWDTATGKQLRLWKQPSTTMLHEGAVQRNAVEGVLSPDGKTIAWEMCCINTKAGCPSSWMDGLHIHDAATNKLLYQKSSREPDHDSEHDEFLYSFAFSSDGKRLAADCEKLAVWEAVGGRELAVLKIPKMVRFALTPDGRRALVEESAADGTKSRLRLWDIDNGKPIAEIYSNFEDLTDGFRNPLPAFSANGRILLIATFSTLHFFDARTGKERASSVRRAAVTPRFSANGRILFAFAPERRCRWDITTMEKPTLLRHEQRKSWEIDFLAHSADERLFLDCHEGRIRVRQTATGRIVRELDAKDDISLPTFGGFTPDASRVVLGDFQDGRGFTNSSLLLVYDVKTGQTSAAIKTPHRVNAPVFSADGRFLAWAEWNWLLHIHDAATGNAVRSLRASKPAKIQDVRDIVLSFSADGDYLLEHGRPDTNLFWPGTPLRPMRVFQIRSGREISRFHANPEKRNEAAPHSCLAWSPDGRLLAVAEKGSGIIRLLEIASGKVRAEFIGHRHGVHGLAFSPDGKTLASGGEDNVVFLWDVIGTRTTAIGNKTTAEWWNDLTSADGKRAGEAIAALLHQPEASLAFLRQQLHPAELPGEKRLSQLLANLDCDSYQKREAASRELARLGEYAESSLRRALKDRPSLEMRRRLEDLLDKLQRGQLPSETLRILRSIEILEYLDTPEARRCLEALAKGMPLARQTREAKRTLHRLSKRGDNP